MGFGNKKSDPITHYAQTKLVGKNGQEISIRFNILKNTIVSELPGITSQILERFPHIADHRRDLTAPIPRGPQTVHAIIGLRDVVKIYNIKKKNIGPCPDICLMMSTDTTNCAIEARKTIFGTIISGSLNGDQVYSTTKRKELIDFAAATKDDDQCEITAIGKEVPLELLFRNVIRGQIDEDIGKSQIIVSFNNVHTKSFMIM